MTTRSSELDSTISELLSLIEKSPEDMRLRLQLFEVLHANNCVDEFVLEALEYKAGCGLVLGEIWGQICKMGREIDPENPFFSEAKKLKMQSTQIEFSEDPQISTDLPGDSEPRHVTAESQPNTQVELKHVDHKGPERREQIDRRVEDRRMFHIHWPDGERRKTTRRSQKRRSTDD